MTLLFLKRLNDIFEEISEKLIKQGRSQKLDMKIEGRIFFVLNNAVCSIPSSAVENIANPSTTRNLIPTDDNYML